MPTEAFKPDALKSSNPMLCATFRSVRRERSDEMGYPVGRHREIESTRSNNAYRAWPDPLARFDGSVNTVAWAEVRERGGGLLRTCDRGPTRPRRRLARLAQLSLRLYTLALVAFAREARSQHFRNRTQLVCISAALCTTIAAPRSTCNFSSSSGEEARRSLSHRRAACTGVCRDCYEACGVRPRPVSVLPSTLAGASDDAETRFVYVPSSGAASLGDKLTRRFCDRVVRLPADIASLPDSDFLRFPHVRA